MSVLTLVTKQSNIGLYVDSKNNFYVRAENMEPFQSCINDTGMITNMVEFLSSWYSIGNTTFVYENTIYDDPNYTVYHIGGVFTAVPKSKFGKVIVSHQGSHDMKKVEDIIGPYLSDKYKIMSDATLYELLLKKGESGYLRSGEHTIEWKHA